MIDDNPFKASTPAVVSDMSPEELVFGPAPLSLFEPPSAMDPVSNLDFPPVDDAFALELRSETIEQLVGGDALRRGESERIEAGRSQTNADLVAGRDRGRVQATLHEHTGHALAEQAAHLHTTVDGVLDVHAASEDTVLLAGHMSDLWDGGGAIVAAMTDDTVAGGGIRVTTPLDLWVHGLMGVEERIGTCTADALLMESSGTHYEREYGPGAHAAGLAVYTGSLYQSSRSTFRALMRVSSGVRNLIAGGGGRGGSGDAGAGSAPATSPPPASAAGGAGTQAASKTLCAATGAGRTAQAGVMAGVRSEDLTGINRGDDVKALAREANVAGASSDLTGLRRGEDTAGQLAALRDAMRGEETGAEGEVTSVLRVPALEDTASVHEASAPDIVTHIRSGATVPGMDAPVLHSTVSPRQPPPGVQIGLLGGTDDSVRPASSSNFLQWQSNYAQLRTGYSRHRSHFNWFATHAVANAISEINARVIETYVEFGGSIDALKRDAGDHTVAEEAYRALRRFAGDADGGGDFGRAREIEQILASINRLTAEFIDKLEARAYEFASAYVEATRISRLDPRIDARKVTDWIEEQIRAGELRRREALLSFENATVAMESQEHIFFAAARHDVSEGRDPRVGSYNRIRYNAEIGRVDLVEAEKPLQARLLEAMADPSMHRPAVQGSEAGGTTPPPFRSEDSGAASRLGEIPGVAGPSSSATTGADAGGLGRGMLDPPVVGPADEAHPGTATPRSGDAQAMATPELGVESTFWLRPVDPVPAPGTVRFDAGLQRTGRQPQPSGEAAMGGTAVHPPFVPDPYGMFDASHITVTSTWSEDAFEVERAMIDGLLPSGFDSSRLRRQLRGLEAWDTEIETFLVLGLLPTRPIDSMIERLRAVEGGRGHIELIQQLEAMKKSVDQALTNAYGYRVDASWLATVDEFLKSRSSTQAAQVWSASVRSRGEDIVGGVQSSLQPARFESAAGPRPTEGGAGELSLGALSPAQGPLSSRYQVGFGEVEVIRFGATQRVSSLGAGGRGIAVGPTGGWQAAETPGFGRLASISAELALSRRAQIVHRLMAGEGLSAARRAELLRGAMIASPAAPAPSAAALFVDLRRLFVAVRTAPGTAASLDIDWNAIETMLRLLDASGYPA